MVVSMSAQKLDVTKPDIKAFFSDCVETVQLKTRAFYLGVIDLPADSQQPIRVWVCLEMIYRKFEVGTQTSYVVVVGDGKTYRHLVNMKKLYGFSLAWMLPFPGDWHLLKNFQSVLMKIYWDGGLREVASATHKSHTLNSLKTASQFKRTHRFLLQSWEAFYVYQLEQYVSSVSTSATLDAVDTAVSHCNDAGEPISCVQLENLSSSLKELHEQFSLHCKKVSDSDETDRFWNMFIHKDMITYVALWLALRRGDWRQRTCCLKEVAPLFHAFDRTTYQDLIVQHIGNIHSYPQEVVDSLESGGFVANISGNSMMSVALDEAHEMLINRETKACLVRTTPAALSKLTGYLPYRSNLLANIKQQIIPKRENSGRESTTFIPRSSLLANETGNVRAFKSVLKRHNLFNGGETRDDCGALVV